MTPTYPPHVAQHSRRLAAANVPPDAVYAVETVDGKTMAVCNPRKLPGDMEVHHWADSEPVSAAACRGLAHIGHVAAVFVDLPAPTITVDADVACLVLQYSDGTPLDLFGDEDTPVLAARRILYAQLDEAGYTA